MLSIRSRSTCVALATLALGAYGCGEKTTTVRQKRCGEICTRFEMCDDATDQTGCVENCNSETFRSNRYFDVKAECVRSLSCNRVDALAETKEMKDCIGDALRGERPNGTAVMLCNKLGNRLPDCFANLQSDALQASCEAVAITLSDEYLRDASSCSDDNACADVPACLTDLADEYDTDIQVITIKPSV